MGFDPFWGVSNCLLTARDAGDHQLNLPYISTRQTASMDGINVDHIRCYVLLNYVIFRSISSVMPFSIVFDQELISTAPVGLMMAKRGCNGHAGVARPAN